MYKPKPDVIHSPSAALRESASFGALPKKVGRALESLAVRGVTKVRFSLKDVFIFDNRDPGKGDIYLVTVVTDNLAAEPIALDVRTFQDIPDRSPLQLGPSGLVIYRTVGEVPAFLDYRILVMESDQEMRDAGQLLDEVRKDPTYQKFRDSLLAVTGATAPAIALATAASDFVIGLIARVLKANRDDQLMYIAGSYDDAFDDLGTQYGLVVHKNAYAKVAYEVEAI